MNVNQRIDFESAAPAILRCLMASMTMFCAVANAQTANLYTKPIAGATGGIAGKVDAELTHALALSRDRVQCFRAALSDGMKSFHFSGLPTGKYDLVLVTKSNAIYEGVALGNDVSTLSATSRKNLEARIAKADNFFNRMQIHRLGTSDQGGKAVLFVERIRDKLILKQSGDVLNSNLRRLEVVDLEKAGDDWTLTTSRHIYREEAPVGEGMMFLRHQYMPELGNVRVIDAVKDLGTIPLRNR